MNSPRRAAQPIPSRKRWELLRLIGPAAAVWGLPWLLVVVVDIPAREAASVAMRSEELRRSVVGSRTDDARQTATLNIAWEPENWMIHTGEDGVITKVYATPGQELHDGSPLIEVSGVVVSAQTQGMPLYRDLRLGDSGPDVLWLNQYLREFLDIAAAELGGVDTFTGQTEEAVSRYAKAIGSLDEEPTFRRQWMHFVGQGRTVGAIHVVLGQVVDLGTPIAVYHQRILSASISPEGPPGRRQLLTRGGLTLEFPGHNQPLEVGGLRLSPADLESIAERVDASTSEVGDVSVRLTSAIEYATIPSGALLTNGPDGSRCMFLGEADGGPGYRAVDVTGSVVESTDPDVLYVPIDYKGRYVVSNPWVQPETYQCT